MRAALIATAMLVVAGLGDVGLELLAASGVFGARYLDLGHQALGAPIDAGVSLLLLLSLWALIERRSRRGPAMTLRAARELARHSPLRDTLLVFAGALLVALGVEFSEQLIGGDLPFGGLPLAGPGALASCAVFGGLAVLSVSALHRLLEALVLGLELIARSVSPSALQVVARNLPDRAGTPPPATATTVACASALVARCFGDRAPPAEPLPSAS